MVNFGNPDQGLHRALVAVLLFGCFAGWALQLGGVASLQACCEDNVPLEDNNIHNLRVFISSFAAASAANTTFPSRDFYRGVVGGLRTLAAKSTRVFTLTPDTDCGHYYRYQWANTGLQLVPILMIAVALVKGALSTSRVAVVALLAVSTVMAIDNAHTFYYVRDFAPDLSLRRGKVFAGGCIITAAVNLALCIALGIQNEYAVYRARGSDSDFAAAKPQTQAIAA